MESFVVCCSGFERRKIASSLLVVFCCFALVLLCMRPLLLKKGWSKASLIVIRSLEFLFSIRMMRSFVSLEYFKKDRFS